MDAARSPGASRILRLVVAVALVGLAATAIVAVVPEARLAERSLSLQAAFETAAALVSLLAAHLLWGRFDRTQARRDLFLAAGLGLLAGASLLFSAVPDVVGRRDGAFAVWGSAGGTLVATALLAAGAFSGSERVSSPRGARWRAALLVAGALAGLGAVAAIAPSSSVYVARSPAGSALLDAPPLLLGVQLATAVGFGVAALGLARRVRRTDDELLVWFTLGAALAGIARLDYFLLPSSFGSWISLGDVLRIGFYLLLLVGEGREIAAYQRGLAASARADERQRVARDLHDGLAQEVAFIATVGERVEAGQARASELAALRRAAERAASESRALIDALNDPEDRPLSAALAYVAAEVAERGGACLRLDVDDAVPLPAPVRQAVVRIVQEGVANAVRHGEAATVDVAVAVSDQVRVSVADDGAGFEPDSIRAAGGFGLTSMRQRAEALGGRLLIASSPGAGTRLDAVLPVAVAQR